MEARWTELETSAYQDHVIAHLLGTTALGYFIADEAVHLLLDIGFIWTVYLDTEMALLPQSVALKELSLDGAATEDLLSDAMLLQAGGDEEGLKRMTALPSDCLITEVACYARGERRRVLVQGEDSSFVIEGSLAENEFRVLASA